MTEESKEVPINVDNQVRGEGRQKEMLMKRREKEADKDQEKRK